MRLLTFILLLCSTSTIAQHKFYIGLEAGPKFERTYITDEGSHLSTNLDLPGGSGYTDFIFGINISYLVTENLQIGSGLRNTPFTDRWALTSDSYGIGSGETGVRGWEIPLEVAIPLNLVRKKLFVVPFISSSIIIMPKTGIRYSRFNEGLNGDISYKYNTVVVRRIGTLIGSGIKVELNTAKCTFITLSVSYHKGLSRIYEVDMDYEVSNSGPLQGSIYTNGGMTYCSLGVRFPITSIPHSHK